MFESIFQDALYNKAYQDHFNTKRATEINSRVRRDNPTMLQYNSNLVDFSNPESVARVQTPIVNPFGYATPNLNPNIKQPTYTTVPVYKQSSPIYYQNIGFRQGYYNMDNLSAADTARFMIPLPGDTRRPTGCLKKPGEKQTEFVSEEEKAFRMLSYKEAKQIKPKVRLIQKSKGINQHKPHRARKINVEFIHKTYGPSDIVTIEDLKMNNRIVKMIEETPLDWSVEDAQELVELLDKLYVYNKALVIWVGGDLVMERETSGFNEWSRERYERMMEYLKNKLKEYQENEKKFPNIIDYRAPYQYRPLPIHEMDEDKIPMFPFQLEPVAEITKDHLTQEKIYKYDRGRDWLTLDEWEIFKGYEHYCLDRGIEKIRAKELADLNQHLLPEEEQAKPEPQLPPWNPRDPVTVRLYQMREKEKEYQVHKDFFRYLTRHSLSDIEFDNWWWGTNVNQNYQYNNQRLSSEDQQRLWVQDMNSRHLQFLNSLQRVDYAQQGAIWRAEAIKRLREYDRGLEPADLSLPEFFNRLGYLAIVRPHELELNRQLNEKARVGNVAQNKSNFMHNMYLASNNIYQQQQAKNPNKRYIPKYGTIDPRYNMPTNFVDLTNNTESQFNMNVARNATKNMGRMPELSTLYK